VEILISLLAQFRGELDAHRRSEAAKMSDEQGAPLAGAEVDETCSGLQRDTTK
jgi:hypothetical protein